MIDIIYEFIRNTLIGQNTTLQGADNLALLLTWAVLVGMFFLLVRLVTWAFQFTYKRRGGFRS